MERSAFGWSKAPAQWLQRSGAMYGTESDPGWLSYGGGTDLNLSWAGTPGEADGI